MTEKKRKPKLNDEAPVEETVDILETDLETEEVSPEVVEVEIVAEKPSKSTVKPAAHYRNILYTPTGHIVPSMSSQTLLYARRTFGDILDRIHGEEGTLDHLYGVYERSSMKRYSDFVRSKDQFEEALDNLIKMGIFQRS